MNFEVLSFQMIYNLWWLLKYLIGQKDNEKKSAKRPTEQSIHARKPSNVAELKQFCKEEWAKIHPQRCERLIASYRKCLIAVVAAKGY